MKPILEIDAISKKYLIQKSGQQPYLSLRDSLAGFFKRSEQQEFWALKDVSFQVQPGESIGIIGKNGAGKSTLLKILSQITPPTSGKITARGRIASLLEVGTGFHAELTGRENIFMNGSILGMKKAEILRNFDAIVDFSGVEQFLETPLKHYSSGMQLRLAFAVAAFLENEILIVDEVLAVGDAEFQKKCLGKMNEVAQSGRTILFVSHNLDVVANLCNRGVLLEKGHLVSEGSIGSIIDLYMNSSSNTNSITPNSDKEFYISNFYIENTANYSAQSLSPVSFKVEIENKSIDKSAHVGIGINDIFGYRLVTPFSMHSNTLLEFKNGRNIVTCEIDQLFLKPGIYNIEIYLGDGYNTFDYQKDNIQIEIIPSFKQDVLIYPNSSQGSLIVKQLWKTSKQ